MLEKLLKINVFQKPCKHIIINHPIPMLDYDHLYEQWNNLTHTVWQKFLKKYQVEVICKNELKPTAHRGKKEFVGYWFFKQRTDRRYVKVKLLDKRIEYTPNVLLILDSEQVFKTTMKNYPMPDMLTCLVYFNHNQQNKIKEYLSL